MATFRPATSCWHCLTAALSFIISPNSRESFVLSSMPSKAPAISCNWFAGGGIICGAALIGLKSCGPTKSGQVKSSVGLVSLGAVQGLWSRLFIGWLSHGLGVGCLIECVAVSYWCGLSHWCAGGLCLIGWVLGCVSPGVGCLTGVGWWSLWRVDQHVSPQTPPGRTQASSHES